MSTVLYGNTPAIHVFGDGSAKASLAAHNDTVGVIIHDKDGKTRVGLTGSGTGPRLTLLDAEGKPVFTAPPDGDSGLGRRPGLEESIRRRLALFRPFRQSAWR